MEVSVSLIKNIYLDMNPCLHRTSIADIGSRCCDVVEALVECGFAHIKPILKTESGHRIADGLEVGGLSGQEELVRAHMTDFANVVGHHILDSECGR